MVGVAVTLAIIALSGFIAVTQGLVPANADARPGGFERWAAKTSLNATVKREMAQTVPIQPSDANVMAGIKLYGQNCSVCHGVATGEPTNIARGFYQNAPQFGKHGVTDDPEGETYWKVTHGIRFTAMPSFSKSLTDEQRWQVTLFLKHQDELSPRAKAAWLALQPAI